MFFSGDSSTRKRVDLGGRSSKERDRQKLLEQTRLERNRRLFQRQQNSSAIKIQKCFRGRKAVEAERSKFRQQFFRTYGGKCQNVDRHCFGPDSEFLRQLLFFFNARNSSDVSALVETCRLLQRFVQDDAVTLFAGLDHSLERHLVDYRVKQLTYACIRTINTNRITSKEELFLKPQHSDSPTVVLLEAVKILIDPELPWACKTVGHLINKNMFSLLREIVLSGKGSMGAQTSAGGSSLEHVLALTIRHIGEGPCICRNVDSRYSFSSQILTIPFLWKTFPNLREVFGMPGLNSHYIHQMALCVRNHTNALPSDTSAEFPGYACLLGNILEANSFALSQTVVLFDLAVDFVDVATFLLGLLPPLKSVVGHYQDGVTMEDDETTLEACSANVLNADLEKQISNAIDSQFIIHLTNVLFGGLSLVDLDQQGPRDKELAAVGSACAFLHVAFNSLPLEHNLTTLTYRTGLVAVLWKFMKLCHESNRWSALSEHSAYLSDGAPGWLLPLAVFCPIYKHMLMVVDNEEFYEQEKPLSLNDLRYLIVILKQALWQLLWVNPTSPLSLAKSVMDSFVLKKLPLEYLQYRVSIGASELLSQLQDWNNRRQFSPPSYFHADGINEYFISQAMQENSRASEVLKLAPSLVPFTSRVKIYASQLDAARRRDSSHSVFARNRLKIRRDHILEDAFNRISALSDEDLHGVIRVTYVNEFGAEEAGIDGGGIFKDFMENITRAAFDVQYGLFKESPGHLLYPNPGSGLIHEQHLQFFHFVGTILAKAMFEGILVDIPFATFFLSKLKQKHNYLNDLTSLDPEMYRHLIFLKHYKGDISELELYFVVVNNEYGEQVEEELIPRGKTIRVTNENVIRFIHLMANHRLNCQIRHQSSHFLRGFQQLIRKDWIDMFNEHELQILISGSVDGLDLDDLRTHTQYSGGYHAMDSQEHISSNATSQSRDPGNKYGRADVKDKNIWYCNFCQKRLSGGVHRLKQHLAGGFRNATKCLKCPVEVRQEIIVFMKEKAETKSSNQIMPDLSQYDNDECDEEEVDVESHLSIKRKRQTKGPMDMFITKKKAQGTSGKQAEINKVCDKAIRDKACADIARFFYDAGIAFNAATYPSFHTMIESIGQYGPEMKGPSMYELRVPLLRNEVEETHKQMDDHKKEWIEKGCSIISDGWRDSVVQKDIVNFLVNSPKGSMFIKSMDVSEIVKDSTLLFHLLDNMVEEIGEKNVIQVVTDNASNYVKAGQMLMGKRTNLYWTPCAAHCVDLILEDIGKLARLKSALKKCMFMNAYIYSHISLVNMMRRFTNQRNLHRPAITRFATSFITLEQFHRQKSNLRKMVTSQEWLDSKWPKEAGGKKVASFILQDTFWRNVVYALKLGGPLIKVLRIVDGERKPPMGYIYEAMDRAKEAIAKSFSMKEDYAKAFEFIDKRWNCQLHRPLHAAGYFLNPEFQYDNPASRCSEVMDGLYDCIERLIPKIEDQDKITKEVELFQNASGLFGKAMAIRQRKTRSPAEWWIAFGASAPNLQKFAVRILSLTCSATGCERNWAVFQHEHYVIEIFWEVIKGFSQENQMKFVKFVTGCSRGPLLGFKCLEPPFCIQRAAGDASDEAFDRLPTAATCMNLLKLPPYQNKEQLQSKLLYAISAEAGFDLS